MNNIPKNILIVDDQGNWRKALSSLVEELGYSVHSVEGFDMALLALEKHDFNLVILDVRLVDTNIYNIQGIELLRIIKERNRLIKVIVITGYPESLHEGVPEQYGANGFVYKVPRESVFDGEEFKNLVIDLLNNENDSTSGKWV